MQLQPVSDLQRAQHFDDYDLTANRAGTLSRRQRRYFLAMRLLEHTIGSLVLLFGGALVINALQLSVISLEWLVLLIGLILLATIGLWLFRARSALKLPVIAAQGLLTVQSPVVLGGAPFDEVAVGKIPFYVRPDVFDVLDVGAVYKVYYLPRDRRLGGNVLLSAEVIRAAPSDDDDD
jgi:hypothetical protein